MATNLDDARMTLCVDLALMSAAAQYDLDKPTERRRSNVDLENLFFHLVRLLEPELFVEAGAKDAGSSRRARAELSSSRIVAFEANPYTHRRFERLHGERNEALGVEYLHRALSDAPGRVTFNVRMTDDGRPSADGQGSLLERDDYEPGYRRVSVEATSLDAFFEGSTHDSSALWIDVEGAAEQVLKGARGLLGTTDFLIIEVQEREFWEGTWLHHHVTSFLLDTGLVPIARDFQSRYLYNVIFVREELFRSALVRHCLVSHLGRCGSSRHQGEMRAQVADSLIRFIAPGLTPAKRRKLRRDPVRFFRDIDLARVASRSLALLRRDDVQ